MNVIELPLANAPERVRDEFVEVLKILAHKLSQPLTCLSGSVEVALMGEINDSDCREVLKQSLEESRRMAEILEALRDVLEIESSGEDHQLFSWKQNIENTLKQAAVTGVDGCVQFTCEPGDEVWVKANPYHLSIATRRLICHLTRNHCRGPVVRVGLAVFGKTACLSIYEKEAPSGVKLIPRAHWADSLGDSVGPEGLDWWILRRVIQRYGGWAKCAQIPNADRCFQINLPLARCNAAQRA